MLPRLFSLVGFGWAVRISGFVCLACCALALASITRRRDSATSASQNQIKRRWFDVTSLKDVRFVFLTTGSALISFGELELKDLHSSSVTVQLTDVYRAYRPIYPLFLSLNLHRIPRLWHDRDQNLVLHLSRNNERCFGPRTSAPSPPRRCHRPLQHPNTCLIPFRSLLPRSLAPCRHQ